MGQELPKLQIQWRRGLIAPALVKHLLHQLPKPVQGANGAGLAERQQEPGAGALQLEAAMGVGVSVCGGHGGAAQDAQGRRGGVKEPWLMILPLEWVE